MQVYKSIGDDIDDFYDRIKMNKINFTNERLLTSSDIQVQSLSNLLQALHSVKTFHLSMLSKKEERKMHSEKTGNQRFVNFKNETKLSKKEKKICIIIERQKKLSLYE